MEEKTTKKYFSGLLLKIAIGLTAAVGCQLLAGVVIATFFPQVLENPTLTILAGMLPLYLIGYPVYYLLVRTTPVSMEIPKKKMKVWQVLLAAVLSFGIMYIANTLGTIIVNIISAILNRNVGNVLNNMATSGGNLIIMIIIMVFAAPICEEIIFRKLIIDRTVAYGEGVAILLSATIFALFHGNVAQMVYAFPIGLLFGFIYVRTGNIKYSMTLHVIINALGTGLPIIMLKFIDINEFTQIAASGDLSAIMAYEMEHLVGIMLLVCQEVLVFGSMAASIVIFIIALVKKKFFLVKRETDLPKGKRFVTVACNIGMLIIVIVTGALTIYQLFAM